MDLLYHLPATVSWVEVLVFAVSIGFVIAVFKYTVLSDSSEQPAPFKLPTPEQCRSDWKGEVLDKPSLTVLSSHLRQ